MKKMPAEDIPVGATVRIPDQTPAGQSYLEMKITEIHKQDPTPNLLTWDTETGMVAIIGMTTKVEVIHMPKKNRNLTAVQFLKERITEVYRKFEGLPNFEAIRAVLSNQEEILELHRNWPVLLTSEPDGYTVETYGYNDNSVTFQVTQRIEWLTQLEYVKRFGKEPPTAPIIKAMLELYVHHPDFNKDWLK